MIPPSVTNSLLDPFGPVEDWSSLLSSRIAKIFASDSTGTKVALPVNMLHGVYDAMKRLEALFTSGARFICEYFKFYEIPMNFQN